MPVHAIQSQRYVVTILRAGKIRKIFQLSFGSDGSVYVHFPYHADSSGIATTITLDPSLTYPANGISLTKQGKVTSHKIKFSHHPDGRAHFSQTGKIFTRIKRQATPLGEIDGHLFTIMFQNLNWFEEGKGDKDKHHQSPERSVIEFVMDDMPDAAYKFVALWRPFSSFVKDIQPSHPTAKAIGPHIVRRKGPNPSAGFLLNPLEGNPAQGYVLVLAIESVPILDKEHDSTIVFIGGFDPVNVVNNKQVPSSFLALMYPSVNPGELVKTIGTIDYEPKRIHG
ncbi:MAG: hypothetical protein RIQ56_364 [Candidatus Parcubacteria bacterium]